MTVQTLDKLTQRFLQYANDATNTSPDAAIAWAAAAAEVADLAAELRAELSGLRGLSNHIAGQLRTAQRDPQEVMAEQNYPPCFDEYLRGTWKPELPEPEPEPNLCCWCDEPATCRLVDWISKAEPIPEASDPACDEHRQAMWRTYDSVESI
jgi:hypothetical protein